MIILIESIIACTIFTIIFGGMTYFKPLSMIHDYPPAIQYRVRKLGLIKDDNNKTKLDLIRKIIAIILFAFSLALVVCKFNGANSFVKGFSYSYLLWNIVNWWDAIVVDCLWFCHSKKVIIKGTEGMKEYKDYLFHIKGGLKGMLYGIPACLLVGIFVLIF